MAKMDDEVDTYSNQNRKADRLYRYGGEEFLLLMPNTPGKQALNVARRIRQKIAGQEFPHAACDLGYLTISAGVASTGGDWKSALANADNALYQAKNAGRNAAFLWTE